ncbi:hypothetical protein MXB_4333 [Myxobolus squamalis]|nr:hypothetical protein MXB_4333 [Myxobolus squamalis]
MHNHHGIQPNLKCLRSMRLSPDAYKRRVPPLHSFTQYHCRTEVSLVAKDCRHGLQESVAKRCTLSVHWH